LVLECFKRIQFPSEAERDMARKNLGALVNHLEQGSAKRTGAWKQGRSWIANAIDEHRRRPFHAIMVLRYDGPRSDDVLEVSAEPPDPEDKKWAPACGPVPRKAKDLIDALAPLLRHARELVLVDPYFDVRKPRYLEPFLGFLEVAQQYRSLSESVEIHVHTSVDGKLEGRWGADAEQHEAHRLVDSVLDAAEGRLVNGTKLHVVIWSMRSRPNSSEVDLHNRYLLAETGGVSFHHGFDTPGRGRDDVEVLRERNWVYWREIYSTRSGTKHFRLVSERWMPQ
jgi:hypothetical protein